MKNVLPLLFLALPGLAPASEICETFKPELKERREDSRFTKGNSKKAIDALKSIIENDTGLDPWYFLIVIEGYLLKREAEKETAERNKDIAYVQYCEFITRRGVHRE